MSDNDLIRRGDAMAAVRTSDFRWEAEDAIAAMPPAKLDNLAYGKAVTVGEPVAHAYIVDGECEQIEWGAEYCLPDDPALTMLYAHPAPDPAAIREAASAVFDLVFDAAGAVHARKAETVILALIHEPQSVFKKEK